VVSFTPRPLYSQGKSPWYPLDRRLGGPQSRSGHRVEEKNSQPFVTEEFRGYHSTDLSGSRSGLMADLYVGGVDPSVTTTREWVRCTVVSGGINYGENDRT
jgi:hypothetical protein